VVGTLGILAFKLATYLRRHAAPAARTRVAADSAHSVPFAT
jgi:hypothetical protein